MDTRASDGRSGEPARGPPVLERSGCPPETAQPREGSRPSRRHSRLRSSLRGPYPGGRAARGPAYRGRDAALCPLRRTRTANAAPTPANAPNADTPEKSSGPSNAAKSIQRKRAPKASAPREPERQRKDEATPELGCGAGVTEEAKRGEERREQLQREPRAREGSSRRLRSSDSRAFTAKSSLRSRRAPRNRCSPARCPRRGRRRCCPFDPP